MKNITSLGPRQDNAIPPCVAGVAKLFTIDDDVRTGGRFLYGQSIKKLRRTPVVLVTPRYNRRL